MRLPERHGSAETIKGQVVGIEKWLNHVKGRDVCVQAGGNIGYFPIELSNHFKHVITFEPEPLNYACLAENCKYIANIEYYQAALGENIGSSGIHFDLENIGAHYLKDEGDIEVMTIDSLNLESCDLIALDIEGYEWQALKGAIKTIEKFHPTIVIEMKNHGKRYGYDDKQMERWLSELGYRDVEKVFRDHVFSYK